MERQNLALPLTRRCLATYLEITVSEPVSRLLDLFDALPESDKRSAVAEILRRSPPSEADIPAAGLDALAGELFATLDSEEDARGPGR